MSETVVQFASVRTGVPPGTRLNDIYEIEEQIAAGGMGEIYRGRLIETGDSVAIKMIKPELATNEAVLALFRKEASALHHLHHDSIVRYYVFSVDRRINRPYLAMEFVEGKAISDLLRTRALSFEEVDNLRKRIASGLQAAHDKGIIHRDISPDNIILPQEDVRQAKIIDFGIARSTKLGQATVIGDGFAGKYNYVSPEQLGLFGGDVTGRSDIYSLGLVLVEALLGKALDMSGSQAEVIDKRRVVPDLSAVDGRIRPLITAMLQPKPEDRPPDMTTVVEWDLSERRGKTRTKFTPTSGDDDAGGSKMPMIAGAAAAVVALAGGIGWFALRPSPPAPAEPAGTRPVAAVAPPANTPQAPVQPPPHVAIAPPPRTGPLDASERARRIANYVRYYEGGQCFIANPQQVTDRAATVQVLSPNEQAIQVFAADFRSVNGFEAKINPILISNGQCGMISFLQRVDPEPDARLQMSVVQPVLRHGVKVQATLSGAGDQVVDAIVVNEDGSIRNVTALTRKASGQTVLDGLLDDQDRTPVGQKLILNVVSAKALTALSATGQKGARQFFSDAADEIESKKQPITTAITAIRYE